MGDCIWAAGKSCKGGGGLGLGQEGLTTAIICALMLLALTLVIFWLGGTRRRLTGGLQY